jgi:hypothetical protein
MPKRFRDDTQLLAFAKSWVEGRLASLKKDVVHCIHAEPYAPFPAMLYCMAHIDFLGALVAGRAEKRARTTENAYAYARDFMRYTDEQANLLQKMFRHKLVHLAQPRPIIEDAGRMISWRYSHEPSDDHLAVKPVAPSIVEVVPGWTFPCDHEFVVSIAQLTIDIMESVRRDGDGYFSQLHSSPTLRGNFERALESILDPKEA